MLTEILNPDTTFSNTTGQLVVLSNQSVVDETRVQEVTIPVLIKANLDADKIWRNDNTDRLKRGTIMRYKCNLGLAKANCDTGACIVLPPDKIDTFKFYKIDCKF